MAASASGTDIDTFRQAALDCPLPHAVELIGEKWAFLIVRGAFNDLKHFEEFQAGLGLARNILSDRLGKLVAGGILERATDTSDRRKVIYSLTPMGKGLMPVLVAMRQWGQKWCHGEPEICLADARDGLPIRDICVQAADGRTLSHGELVWRPRHDNAGSD